MLLTSLDSVYSIMIVSSVLGGIEITHAPSMHSTSSYWTKTLSDAWGDIEYTSQPFLSRTDGLLSNGRYISAVLKPITVHFI